MGQSTLTWLTASTTWRRAVGSGHNGSIGSVGIMGLLGAATIAASTARGAPLASGAAPVSEGATMSSYELLMGRIQAAKAAIAAGGSNGASVAPSAGMTSGPAGPARSHTLATAANTLCQTAVTASSGGAKPFHRL